MTYNQLMRIVNNKHRYRYNNATSGGSDNSMDASAATINPNNYLAPTVQQRGVIRIMVIVALGLLIILLAKKVFK